MLNFLHVSKARTNKFYIFSQSIYTCIYIVYLTNFMTDSFCNVLIRNYIFFYQENVTYLSEYHLMIKGTRSQNPG